jgi:hypothetical protein
MCDTQENGLAILEVLRLLWKEIIQLTPRQRLALLLNPPGGEVEVFHLNGIATIPEIAAALQITNEQFELIWRELPMGSEDRRIVQSLGTCDEKFAFLWNHLPLPDAMIAKFLNVNRQDVINLRMLARRRLRSKCKHFYSLSGCKL